MAVDWLLGRRMADTSYLLKRCGSRIDGSFEDCKNMVATTLVWQQNWLVVGMGWMQKCSGRIGVLVKGGGGPELVARYCR